VQTDELLTVSLDERGNWTASGEQGAEFENNFGFASMDSIESLRMFFGLENKTLVSAFPFNDDQRFTLF